MSIIQPTKVVLKECVIGSTPHITVQGNNVKENFAVHSLRIYEDICKSYFTGQMVIEDQINQTDPYLYPATQVIISFMSLPNNKTYTEKFRIYSIESKPKENDKYAGMLITLSLIGDEYYNDMQNTVMRNFKNMTATSAAQQIHSQFLAENGGIQVSSSIGMIGMEKHPHQVLNMKPIKAIHDLLDKAVKPPTSAYVYFRNKPGYVIAPLQELLESSAMAGDFIHKPSAGDNLKDVLTGYNNIIHFRPMAPPSQETAQGIRSMEIDSLMKTSSFFDMKTGNFEGKGGSGLSGIGGLAGSKGKFGARQIFNAINEDRQPRAVDKNGPAGHNIAEEKFIASLAYSKKYWISVPMQSGIDVTIGRRIKVVYPVGERMTEKTLFVVRLIQELQFKTPGQKKYEPAQGSTDCYCVEW